MPAYRLRNWAEYNRALAARGSLTIWIEAEALAAWRAAGRTGRRGRPAVYSDLAIRCMLTLAALYRQRLRQTAGLVGSLFRLLGVALPVASAATLSRRRARLAVPLPVSRPRGPLHLVVDSTGLALVGEGEWQRHRSRRGPRLAWCRRYLKVHLGVDEATGELRVAGASALEVSDGEMLPALLAAEPAPLSQVTGDGMYDEWRCYEAVAARPERPRAVFPPPRPRRGPKRARVRRHGNRAGPRLDRDEHVRAIRRLGRRRWKELAGYHRRSLAETAVARLKGIFGERLTPRSFAAQATEVFLRCAALNRMTHLGMPDSHAAA